MVTVRDQLRTVEAPAGTRANSRSDEVARVADRTGDSEYRQVGGSGRMDETINRLHARDARADEDRGDDGQARASLRDLRAQRERDAKRHGGQRIPEVVDQVGEQGDAAAGDEHCGLSQRGKTKDGQGQRDGAYALAGALDAVPDQSVRMTGTAVVRVAVSIAAVGRAIGMPAVALVVMFSQRPRNAQAGQKVTMGASVGVAMHTSAVPMCPSMLGVCHEEKIPTATPTHGRLHKGAGLASDLLSHWPSSQ
jgi:hypothetical protein